MNEVVEDVRAKLLWMHKNIIDERYVFIRIPKTGSASLNMALFNVTWIAKEKRIRDNEARFLQAPDEGAWWDHYPATWVRESLGPDAWNKSIKFAVVRNPFARLYSLWKSNDISRETYTFKEWLLGGVPYGWTKEHHEVLCPPNPILSQKSWIADSSGNIMVNFICRLEEINLIGTPMFSVITTSDFKFADHWMNKTSSVDEYKKHYDDEMKEFVFENCKDDLESFHYTFDGPKEFGWFYWEGDFAGEHIKGE